MLNTFEIDHDALAFGPDPAPDPIIAHPVDVDTVDQPEDPPETD